MSVRFIPMTRLASLFALAALSAAIATDVAAQSDAAKPRRTEQKPEAKKPAAKPAAAKPAAAKPAAAKPAAAKPVATPAAASPTAGATLVQSFGDWSAYTAQTGRAKICYALSEPKARAPGNLKDTKAYLFVSFRPADNVRNEVASVLNFETKEGGAATLSIASANYELVTKGKNAWVRNPADEAAAIGVMSKGGSMTVQATSAKGNKTSDRYSLAGFAQALDRAKRDCP